MEAAQQAEDDQPRDAELVSGSGVEDGMVREGEVEQWAIGDARATQSTLEHSWLHWRCRSGVPPAVDAHSRTPQHVASSPRVLRHRTRGQRVLDSHMQVGRWRPCLVRGDSARLVAVPFVQAASLALLAGV